MTTTTKLYSLLFNRKIIFLLLIQYFLETVYAYIAIISPIHDQSLIDRRDSTSFFLARRLIRPSCAPIRSAHKCIVNRRGIRRRIIREEAFQSRESHRKHPRRRGPSSISSLRLSMTSRRRKYHAVREVQSCGPDVWSRSQSFPDSQKFSITSLFDNTLLSEFSTIDRSRIEKGIPSSPPLIQRNRVDNPEDFPCA